MIRSFFILLFVSFIVCLVLGGSFVWDAYFVGPVPEAEEMVFMVNRGDAVKDISARLKQDSLIESPFWFEVYVWITKTEADFQAGLFSLKPGMSYHTLVSTLTHAKAQEVQITFPEGYTVEQMGEVIKEAFSAITLLDWNITTDSQSPVLSSGIHLLESIPDGQGLEGYLFPDTYRFTNEVSAESIAETLVLTLQRRLAENNIILEDDLVMENGMTLHELLTLASIIEKEVPDAEGMKIVADIFLKRLKIGMALQACSTVNYVTGKEDPAVTF